MQSILNSCSSVLFLGEANFSFSVTLRRMLPDTVAMVTSCLQSRELLLRDDALANANIRALSELGAQVLFGVDATKLGDCPALEGAVFDAIVFTFPHVGGKGNIGRNRELLRKFFECCPKFLAPNGQALVTLCNGQGGTPADRPQRKWADSWQVVAMATYGSFVLTRTVLFDAEDYTEYYCTGYRSQSKQFRTRNAVTHVFERGASPVSAELHVPVTRQELQQGSPPCHVTLNCPPDLARNIGRNLLADVNHPLHHLSQELQQLLQHSFPSFSVLQHEHLPLLVNPGEVLCTEQIPPSELYTYTLNPDGSKPSVTAFLVYPTEEGSFRECQNGNCKERTQCSSNGQSNTPEPSSLSNQTIHHKIDSALRTSATDSTVNSTDGITSHSACLRSQCEVRPQCSTTMQSSSSTAEVALEHKTADSDISDEKDGRGDRKHMTLNPSPGSRMEASSQNCGRVVARPNLLCHLPDILDGNLTKNSFSIPSSSSSSCILFGKVLRRCGIGITQYPIMHQCLVIYPACTTTDTSASWDSCQEKLADSLSTLLEGRGMVSVLDSPSHCDGKLEQRTSLVIEMEEPNQFDKCTVTIGCSGVYHSSDGDVAYNLLNLDYITMIKYGIGDVRLFWSQEERTFTKFRNYLSSRKMDSKSDQENPKQSENFVGFSLYPPAYTHDLSFWLSNDDTFDELRFCSVLRSATSDLLREVKFLNQYANRRVSYTYRLVYQSLDGALSKTMANHLQQVVVREAINKWLGVEPR